MKKIYTFLLVASVIGNVYAQDSVKKVSFLVKGGVNFSGLFEICNLEVQMVGFAIRKKTASYGSFGNFRITNATI